MVPNNFAAYAERIRDGVQQKMQAKSGPELLVGTAIVILRLTNVSRSLMQQRNIAMLNGPKLSRTDNFLYVFGLASTLVGLTINGIELNRRVRAGQ